MAKLVILISDYKLFRAYIYPSERPNFYYCGFFTLFISFASLDVCKGNCYSCVSAVLYLSTIAICSTMIKSVIKNSFYFGFKFPVSFFTREPLFYITLFFIIMK